MQKLTIVYFESSPHLLVGHFHEKVQQEMDSVAIGTVMHRCSPSWFGLIQYVNHAYGIH